MKTRLCLVIVGIISLAAVGWAVRADEPLALDPCSTCREIVVDDENVTLLDGCSELACAPIVSGVKEAEQTADGRDLESVTVCNSGGITIFQKHVLPSAACAR